jgi:hypothetical protein
MSADCEVLLHPSFFGAFSFFMLRVPGQELGVILFATMSRTIPAPTQLLIQRVTSVTSPLVNKPQREADISSPPNTEV